MTQPTAEAYKAARQAAHDWLFRIPGRGGIADDRLVHTIADAVWPLAMAEGRRQRDAELAPFIEAATACVEEQRLVTALYPDTPNSPGKRALIAAVDALTRGDTDND